MRPLSVHWYTIYFHILCWGMEPLTHTYTKAPTTSDHLLTVTFIRRGNLKCSLEPSCMWIVGGKVKCLEESHADTQRTCKPHTERISCLGTELFVNWGCDHFWAKCGINHANLCANDGGALIMLTAPGGGWKRWTADDVPSTSWRSDRCGNVREQTVKKGLFIECEVL